MTDSDDQYLESVEEPTERVSSSYYLYAAVA